MKYYAVIDTNVVVSAFLNHNSIPGTVLEAALYGQIIPLLCKDILEEYKEVLQRPKFKFNNHDIEIILTELIKRGVFVDVTPIADYASDPDDAIFYQVVMEVRKTNNAYLVTGNIKYFPIKNFIVTPKKMLEIINRNNT